MGQNTFEVERFARCKKGCELVECEAFEFGQMFESIREAQVKLKECQWKCSHCKGTDIKTFSWYTFGGYVKGLYKDKDTAELMHYRERNTTSYETEYERVAGVVSDIYDSEKYAQVRKAQRNSKNPELDCAFSIDSDGVEASGTSMWPWLSLNLNYSPFIRNNICNIAFHGIYRLLKGCSVESHMLPFVLESIDLFDNGVHVFDASTQKSGVARVFFMSAIVDTQGAGDLLSFSAPSGKYGCTICDIKGTDVATGYKINKRDLEVETQTYAYFPPSTTFEIGERSDSCPLLHNLR
jgi:hypothetical protein